MSEKTMKLAEYIFEYCAKFYDTPHPCKKMVAEALDEAGYRLATEVAEEIFVEIEQIFDLYSVILDGETGFFSLIAELKKKYTEGGE